MDKFELEIFQTEIKRQCEFALFSVANINALFKNPTQDISDQFWYHIQGFLISTANVSKLIWGSNKTETLRQSLRESLDISENKFKEIRKLRNDFEHFDERIETWARTSERKNFVDSNIGPTNGIVGFDTNDYLRNFDTSKGAVTFKGKEYALQPVVDELVILQEKISQLHSTPHWER